MKAPSMMIGRRREIGMAMRVLSLVIAAGALSGCMTAKEGPVYPNDYRKRHPIALRESPQTVEVFVGSNRSSLTGSQRADVLAFAKAWNSESTGGIVIDVPANSPNSLASSQASREIRSILRSAGVPERVVAMRGYEPESPYKLSVLRMSYSKITAEAGPCGLWPQDLGPTSDPIYNENRPFWNLGCSNQRNLAAMVANPADLVQPRGEGPVWASRRATVLERYRVGQGTATTYPNMDRGMLSDIGK